jgi:hypothetical protein
MPPVCNELRAFLFPGLPVFCNFKMTWRFSVAGKRIKMSPKKYRTVFLVAFFYMSCSTPQKVEKNILFFKDFDIFHLSGTDTIPASKIKTEKGDFVRVNFKNNFPSEIAYHFSNRKVVLKLDTTFVFNDRLVYVYYTGNLLGGKAGRQREYAFHYIDNGYKLFVDLSDTMIVKNYDNIDIKSGNSYHYMLYVYLKNESKFQRYFLRQADSYPSITDSNLYKSWDWERRNSKPGVISDLITFPPR